MPKARKTGNKCVTKMLRKAVTEPPKDNAPPKPTEDRAPIVKKEPVIDDSPGPSRSTTPIPREQSTTSTLDEVLNDVSFATGARRLYGMVSLSNKARFLFFFKAQALLQEDVETTPASKKVIICVNKKNVTRVLRLQNLQRQTRKLMRQHGRPLLQNLLLSYRSQN